MNLPFLRSWWSNRDSDRPMDQPPQPVPEPTPDGDRLDSWKEIAVYLDRGVRTVQRWEKEQSLPVHRHKNRQHQGPVFAFKGEIDVWWRTHRTELEGENGNGETPAVRRPSGACLACRCGGCRCGRPHRAQRRHPLLLRP